MVTYFGLIYFFYVCFGISICFYEPILSLDDFLDNAYYDEDCFEGYFEIDNSFYFGF